jgi:hypothetical protein
MAGPPSSAVDEARYTVRMSEQTPQPNRDEPDESHPEYEVAERMGRSLGRFARAARAAAKSAQPEADRAARQVRSAADAARPRIQQATNAARPRIQRTASEALIRTGRFLEDHEPELRQAARAGAQAVAFRSTPPILRPVISAATDDLLRPRPPRTAPPPRVVREDDAEADGDSPRT